MSVKGTFVEVERGKGHVLCGVAEDVLDEVQSVSLVIEKALKEVDCVKRVMKYR